MAKRERERRSDGEGMLRRGSGNGEALGRGDASAHEVAERQHCKLRGESHDTAAARVWRGQGACVQFTLDGQAPRGSGPDNPVQLCDGGRVV